MDSRNTAGPWAGWGVGGDGVRHGQSLALPLEMAGLMPLVENDNVGMAGTRRECDTSMRCQGGEVSGR